MKLRIYENHICELQSEELNEGWSLVLYMQLLQLQKEAWKKFWLVRDTADMAFFSQLQKLHISPQWSSFI